MDSIVPKRTFMSYACLYLELLSVCVEGCPDARSHDTCPETSWPESRKMVCVLELVVLLVMMVVPVVLTVRVRLLMTVILLVWALLLV